MLLVYHDSTRRSGSVLLVALCSVGGTRYASPLVVLVLLHDVPIAVGTVEVLHQAGERMLRMRAGVLWCLGRLEVHDGQLCRPHAPLLVVIRGILPALDEDRAVKTDLFCLVESVPFMHDPRLKVGMHGTSLPADVGRKLHCEQVSMPDACCLSSPLLWFHSFTYLLHL